MVIQGGPPHDPENIEDIISDREFIQPPGDLEKERQHLEWKLAHIFHEGRRHSAWDEPDLPVMWDPPDIRVVCWK